MNKDIREVVARLRRECPWDAKQTLESIRHLYIEEAYELSEALESGDSRKIEEEFGDLLYVVLMGIQIAQDMGVTSYDQVETTASDKLIRRHPHVFSNKPVSGETEVLQNWERIKQEEKLENGDAQGFFTGIPRSLPALLRAQMMQERAARVGFDWPPSSEPPSYPQSVCPERDLTFTLRNEEVPPKRPPDASPHTEPPSHSSAYGPLAKIHEEARELAEHIESGNKKELEHELGDLLFSVVNLARHIGVRAEEALTRSNRKFERRFEGVRKLAKERNLDLSELDITELDKLWDEVKKYPQENS